MSVTSHCGRTSGVLSAFVLSATSIAIAQTDDSVQRHVSLVLDVGTATRWREEVVPVVVRLAFERDFRTNRLVSPFAQPLDLPVRVEAPDLVSDSVREVSARSIAVAERVTVVWNGARSFLRRMPTESREGRTWDVFEGAFDVAFHTARMHELGGPVLRLTIAERFEEDLFSERRPVDPREVDVAAEPARIDVRDWPEGAPASFQGAVGRFTWRASLDQDGARGGESIRVGLHLGGTGNFARVGTPSLTRLDGFHVLGVLPEDVGVGRAWNVDVRVARGASAFPRVAFSFLPPGGTGTYETLWTDPLPLRVETVSEVTQPQGRASTWRAIGKAPRSGWPSMRTLVLCAWIAPIVFAGATWCAREFLRRARLRRIVDPRDVADQRYHEGRRTGGRSVEALFVAYLSTHLASTEAAVIGPELAGRLRERDVPEDLARAVVEELQRLTAARYGGRAMPDAEERVDALVQALQPVLLRRSRS